MNRPFEWREAPKAEYAVIGDPISHSLSPKMMAAASGALNIPFRYNAIRVPSGEVGIAFEYLASTGYRGVNVTVPHKKEAWDWLESSDDFSNRIRAANTIDLISRNGINTDGPGFTDTLRDLGLRAPGTVTVLGAGSSARAICLSLVDAGFGLRLWNRTASRAEDLVVSLGLGAELLGSPMLGGADLIVNATSASLSGDDLELDWGEASKEAIAYDLVYSAEPSSFLRGAIERGLKSIDGIPLLVAQGARSLEWWLGVTAPREAMLKALR